MERSAQFHKLAKHGDQRVSLLVLLSQLYRRSLPRIVTLEPDRLQGLLRVQYCGPSSSISASLHQQTFAENPWERLMYRKVLLAYDGSIDGGRCERAPSSRSSAEPRISCWLL